MNAAAGLPAVLLGATNSSPGQLRIIGHLTADAELRFTPGERTHALLFLQIKQPDGIPYEVRQDCGADVAFHIAAQAKQHLLRKGALVTVYATGITQRTDHGHAVLLLRGVTDVIPVAVNRHPLYANNQES